MSEDEIPAALDADVSADSSIVDAPAPAKAPEITTEATMAAAAGVDAAFKSIKSQPTVKIRVPKVYGPQVVIINGARFNVPSNVFVEVPEQVAQILADSGRI